MRQYLLHGNKHRLIALVPPLLVEGRCARHCWLTSAVVSCSGNMTPIKGTASPEGRASLAVNTLLLEISLDTFFVFTAAFGSNGSGS